MEGYLSFYSANFELPGAQSRAQWESQRRARIASKASIEVDISNLNVQINGEEATAEFDQAYKADKYSDNIAFEERRRPLENCDRASQLNKPACE